MRSSHRSAAALIAVATMVTTVSVAMADGDPTATRRKILEEHVDTFRLSVLYLGQTRDISDVVVRTGKERGFTRGNAWLVEVTILRDDALKLIKGLADKGFLRDAIPVSVRLSRQSHLKDKTGFVLEVASDQYAQHEFLGDEKATNKRLRPLRNALTRDAASVLDDLLQALEERAARAAAERVK